MFNNNDVHKDRGVSVNLDAAIGGKVNLKSELGRKKIDGSCHNIGNDHFYADIVEADFTSEHAFYFRTNINYAITERDDGSPAVWIKAKPLFIAQGHVGDIETDIHVYQQNLAHQVLASVMDALKVTKGILSGLVDWGQCRHDINSGNLAEDNDCKCMPDDDDCDEDFFKDVFEKGVIIDGALFIEKLVPGDVGVSAIAQLALNAEANDKLEKWNNELETRVNGKIDQALQLNEKGEATFVIYPVDSPAYQKLIHHALMIDSSE